MSEISTYTSCVPIRYTINVYSDTLGGIGDLFAEIKAPHGVILDSARVYLPGGVPIVIDTITSMSIDSANNLWIISFRNSTAFSSGSAFGSNGLNGGEQIAVDFWLIGGCNNDSIGTVRAAIRGNLYCGSTISEAVAMQWLGGPDLEHEFNPIALSGGVCGSIVSLDYITTGSCNGTLLFDVSGNNGPGTLDTLWVPTIPNFSSPVPGTYYVAVTNANGCKSSDTVVISGQFSIRFKLLDTPCDTIPGITLKVDSLPPGTYTYAWTTGSTNDTANIQPSEECTVIVTSASGCADSATITIPSLSLAERSHCLQSLDTLTFLQFGDTTYSYLSKGVPPFTFLWSSVIDTSIHYAIPINPTGDPYIFTYTIPDSLLDKELYLFFADSAGCAAITQINKTRYLCCFSNAPGSALINFFNDTTISTPTIISNGYIYVEDYTVLTITGSFTLTNCEIVMGEGATISIEDSGVLNLIGSYVHGCKRMWNGIFATDYGRLQTNKLINTLTRIEDAMEGIGAFGVVARMDIRHTEFNRNRYGVRARYGGAYDTVQYNVSDCYFGMGPYTAMLPSMAGADSIYRPIAGVELKLSKMDIPNPYIGGGPNTFENMNNGIMVDATDINIYNNYFRHIHNTAGGYRWGAAVYATSGANFNANTRLRVKTGSGIPTNTSQPNFKHCDFGVSTNLSKVIVEQNRMDSVRHCISTLNSTGKVYITQNYLSNTYYGVTLNSNVEQEVWENNIVVNKDFLSLLPTAPSFLRSNSYGIFQTGPNAQVPVSSSIYNNTIWDGANSIILSNTNGAQVFANTIFQTSAFRSWVPQAGIYAANCLNLVVEDNNIIGNTDVYGPVSSVLRYDKSGISFYHTTAEVCSNRMDTIGHCVMLASECMGTNLRTNEFRRSKYGIFIQSSGSASILGRQGIDTSTLKESHQNKFIGDGTSTHRFGGGFRTYSNIIIPSSTPYRSPFFYYTGANNQSNVLLTDTSQGILRGIVNSQAAISAQLISSLAIDSYECAPLFANFVEPWDSLVAGGGGEEYMENEIFSETGSWLARRKLFNKLNMDTNLLSIDTTIRKFYNTTGTTVIGRIQNYEQGLRLLSDTAVFADYKIFSGHLYNAENLLEGVEYSNTAEENYVKVNQIYLNKLDSPATAFSPSQLNTLRNLAVQCPYIAGDAVYIARSLLAREEDSIFYYDLHLCTIDSGSAKKDGETFIPANEIDSVSSKADSALTEMIKVYPNPASSQINLKYKAVINGNAEFQLFNIYGQLVKTDPIAHNVYSTTFNIINIPVGIYCWKLKDSSRTIATGRVNIVR